MIKVEHQGKLQALIIPGDSGGPGVNFLTPDGLSQQVAIMRHPSGKKIQPHVHNPVKREIAYTQEVLILRKGKMRVDFYSESQSYLRSYVVNSGDIVVLVQGGHGFEALEELEMIEVKQGPYVGEQDKVRFEGKTP